jgi:peptidoglycan hydrolase CwlO-like protein
MQKKLSEAQSSSATAQKQVSELNAKLEANQSELNAKLQADEAEIARLRKAEAGAPSRATTRPSGLER